MNVLGLITTPSVHHRSPVNPQEHRRDNIVPAGLMGIMRSTKSESSHFFIPDSYKEAVGLASRMQATLENKHPKFANTKMKLQAHTQSCGDGCKAVVAGKTAAKRCKKLSSFYTIYCPYIYCAKNIWWQLRSANEVFASKSAQSRKNANNLCGRKHLSCSLQPTFEHSLAWLASVLGLRCRHT